MVCSDIVADLQRNLGLDIFSERNIYGERFYVGSSEDFYIGSFLGRSGRNYHIVVYQELFGHYIRRHVSRKSGICEYACERRDSGCFGRNKVDLTVLCSASA